MMLKNVITARFCLVRAKVLELLGELVEAENEALMAHGIVHKIGWDAWRSKAEMPAMVKQEKALAQAWSDGKADAECDDRQA